MPVLDWHLLSYICTYSIKKRIYSST